jgi:hypothetical protein
VLVFTPVVRNTDRSELEDLDSIIVYRMEEPIEPGKGGRERMPAPPAEKLFSEKAKKIGRMTHQDLSSFTERGKVYFPIGRVLLQTAPGKPPLVSFFAIRTTSRRGRASRLSNLAALVVEKAAPPPSGLSHTLSENLCVLSWEPPHLEEGGEPSKLEGYDVYRRREGSSYSNAPLNAEPIAGTRYEDKTLLYGETYCYTVSALVSGRTGPVEGSPAPELCVGFKDIYPPEPPQKVSSISGRGSIKLVWEEKPGSDVAGYNVYRKPGTGKDWVKLNDKPIRETTFTDTGVQTGTRYEYRITAIDNAEPPNESSPSGEVSEFAL